jgi:RNA polymerase sigma-70 factor (ECF subfamily)
MQGAMTAPPVDASDDEALVRLALAERADAFRALYERHKDELHAFVVRLVRDDALAEDVFQEAFLRVHRHLRDYDPARPFRSWLYQIARNAALDALRTRGKDRRLERARARDTSLVTPPALEEAASLEARTRAREALEALPEETRALLIQRHGLGMTLGDLAASFSCNERTVRRHLVVAGELLAQALLDIRSRNGGRP